MRAKTRVVWGVTCVLSVAAWGCGDDDEGPAQVDAGTDGGRADSGSPRACAQDADCDDGLFCTGDETCVAGECVAGRPVSCDDDLACTVDRCSEVKRACESRAPDEDGDGHLDAACADGDGKPFGDDCDDADPLRFPGNIESCDEGGRDEDCDPTTFGAKDSDDDGAFDARCCNGSLCGTDCDDLKPSVNPKATEACDLYDNDCDGEVDEGVAVTQYVDADRDGHGKKNATAAETKRVCAGTVGYALEKNDCDDGDPTVFEGQFEICDDKDNDCDGNADEVEEDAPWFVDADGDQFGDATSTPIYSCEPIPGRVLSHNDCDDENPAVHPAAAEACDAVDNDCSGKRDFSLGVNDFEDDDNDGIADDQCPGGQDCNDVDPTTGEGREEICDGIDNDCDDAIDEQTAQTVWYLDRDGDGWGIDQGTALARCEPIPGRSANLGDCDDDENSVHPTAPEACNGADDDCDGDQDEGADFLCAVPNAVSFCKQGGCAVLSCFPGFGDLNADELDGCEATVPILPLPDPYSPGNDLYCTTSTDCDDGDYCNGKERCDVATNKCYPGTPINCSASGSVLQGSFFIHNSLDIQTLAGIQTITGDVTISAPGLVHLKGLESLGTVGGDLVIDGDLEDDTVIEGKSLQALVGSGLSNLTTVGGDLVIEDNPALTVIRLPGLVTAGGLYIRRNAALAALDGFDSLVRVHGTLEIEDNPALATLSGLQALRRAGSLLVGGNALTAISLARLAHLDMGLDLNHASYGAQRAPEDKKLVSIGLPELLDVNPIGVVIEGMVAGVRFAYFDALTTLSLPKLTAVGDTLQIAYNKLLDDPSLPAFELGAYYLAVSIYGNPALTTLSHFGAATVSCPGGNCVLSVSDNASYPSCDASVFTGLDDPANPDPFVLLQDSSRFTDFQVYFSNNADQPQGACPTYGQSGYNP